MAARNGMRDQDKARRETRRQSTAITAAHTPPPPPPPPPLSRTWFSSTAPIAHRCARRPTNLRRTSSYARGGGSQRRPLRSPSAAAAAACSAACSNACSVSTLTAAKSAHMATPPPNPTRRKAYLRVRESAGEHVKCGRARRSMGKEGARGADSAAPRSFAHSRARGVRWKERRGEERRRKDAREAEHADAHGAGSEVAERCDVVRVARAQARERVRLVGVGCGGRGKAVQVRARGGGAVQSTAAAAVTPAQ